jgi:phosphate acetyltransferase
MTDDEKMLENHPFDELAIGDSASLTRTLTLEQISLFAAVSGDVNPAHMDAAFAATDRFGGVIGHGLWTASLISAILGAELPGPGAIYRAQNLTFLAPVAPGDTITTTVTVREKIAGRNVVRLDCACVNQAGVTVLTGVAEVLAPTEKVRLERPQTPDVRLQAHGRYKTVIATAREGQPLATAIVHPCDEHSLRSALEAAAEGLIKPVLVGPAAKIKSVADAAGLDISHVRLEAVAHSHAAADRACALARDGVVKALMKGSLHTDELMRAVLAPEAALRTDRRLSHVYMLDVPAYHKPLLVTDAAINIAPTLKDKRDICQNAIDLARLLGAACPKVAVLSAVETVDPNIPSTVDAAALTVMARRGQISGAIVDGPFAFDNAISIAAARTKGIASDVAGDADILLVPDLESGNMLAKQLLYFANADGAGLVLGARTPIILTSRADSVRVRLASAALAKLVALKRPIPNG